MINPRGLMKWQNEDPLFRLPNSTGILIEFVEKTSRRAAEKKLALFSIFVGYLFVQINPESRLIGHSDVTIADQRRAPAFDKIIKERDGSGVPLERQKIRNGGAEMNGGHGTDWTRNIVGRDSEVMHLRHVRDAPALEQSAYFLEVGRRISTASRSKSSRKWWRW